MSVDDGLLPWSDLSNIIEEILGEIDPPQALEGVPHITYDDRFILHIAYFTCIFLC